MKHAFCLAAVFASVFGSTILHAQSVIPQVMSFQGYVTQSDTAYTDTVGNTNVDLVLYDDSANGNQVWSHLGQKVKVFHGYYTVPLDFSTGWAAGVVHWSKQYWLDAFILNQELSPRVQLTSSAYSFVADTALHVASSVPIGTIEAYAFDLAQLSDSSWLPCDGRTVAKKDYPIYYQSVGNTYGNSTTDSAFLPDLRGLFLRGVNQVNNQNRNDSLADPDAALRSANNNGNAGNKVGSIQKDTLGSHTHAFTSTMTSETFVNNVSCGACAYFAINNSNPPLGIDPAGGHETRPKNAYVYWIIKVK